MNYYHAWKKLVNRFLILSFTFIDLINVNSINSKLISRVCFSELKYLLFEISGQCIHSGMCCNNIQIKYKGKWIKTVADLSSIQKQDKVMTRFKPNFNSNQIIHSFSCDSLNAQNFCNDYDTRPKFCRVYPFSVFFSNDSIKPGCGFYVKQRNNLPFFSSQKLQQKFNVFKFNHSLN